MTQGIVLKSLEELGRFSDVIVRADAAEEVRALVPVVLTPTVEPDLDALAEAASRAAEELRDLVAADARARREAEETLARYRRLQGDGARLEQVVSEAQAVAEQASALAERSFTPTCGERARAVATAAATMAAAAGKRRAEVEAEVAGLAVGEDVARLLAEERAREEEARRKEEEHRQEARLREGIARAEALANEGKLNEARRLLGSLCKIDPNSPDLASCIERIRRQQWAVKTYQVEEALHEARRRMRREPREATAALEPLDLSDMPDTLTRQAYGCWLAACRRLRLANALHYRAAFGKGAVLVPTGDDGLEVVSAIGLPRWGPGRHLSRAALKGARPLD